MFGSVIRELRQARNLNQVQLAKELKVTKQTVSNWENNNISPSIEMLVNIANANSHFLRTAGPYFPDSPGHIKRTAWDISRAEGTPPY